jgi:MFS superfamily sulfate permease-like transporter
LNADFKRWIDYAKWKCEVYEKERSHGAYLMFIATILSGFILSMIALGGVAVLEGFLSITIVVGGSLIAFFIFVRGWKKMYYDGRKYNNYVEIIDEIMEGKIDDVDILKKRLIGPKQ